MIVKANFEKKHELDNEWFPDFDPEHRYFVLTYSNSHLRILAEDRYEERKDTHGPYCYPKEMFIIVDNTVPQDWHFMYVGDWDNYYSVKDFNIFNESDICSFQKNEQKNILLLPSICDRFTFVEYCEREKEAVKKLKPYLQGIHQKQLDMNKSV